MLSMRRIFIALTCLCGANFLQAQGYFLDKGVSGFGIDAGFSSNDTVTGFGCSTGYSFKGLVDVGLFAGLYSLDGTLNGYSVSATDIIPSVTAHVFKQNERIPFSLAINAAYGFITYSSDALDNAHSEWTANHFAFGFTIYRYFLVTQTVKLQPSIGVGYSIGQSNLSDNLGNSIKTDINTANFSLALSVYFNTSPSTIFLFTPALNFDKDNTTFSLSIGFVFPTS